METPWNTALWRQFGATLDMLDNAVAACPDSLWTEHVWHVPPSTDFPPQFAQFWYLSFHALVWLDLYLTGVPEEDFVPPAPFVRQVLDSADSLPVQPYSKEQLRAYLTSLREKCRTTLTGLTDEQACRTVEYPWSGGQSVSYLELQIYNLRHIQEHAAQLSLFLGHHGVPDEALDWVPLAKA